MWGAIIAGAGMLMDASSSRMAGIRNERVTDSNARLVMDETREEARRLSNDIKQSEGLSAAMSAASGVTMSGSRKKASDNTRRENQAQLDWLRKTGQQKADVVRRGGQLQTAQLNSQSQSKAIQGFGQIAQGIYSNYN